MLCSGVCVSVTESTTDRLTDNVKCVCSQLCCVFSLITETQSGLKQQRRATRVFRLQSEDQTSQEEQKNLKSPANSPQKTHEKLIKSCLNERALCEGLF